MNSRVVMLQFAQDGLLVERRQVALVELEPGERVSEAIRVGAQMFGAAGELYAFVGRIPAGVEEFTELTVDDALVTLVRAAWVPAGAVMVGGRGERVYPPVQSGFQGDMDMEVRNA